MNRQIIDEHSAKLEFRLHKNKVEDLFFLLLHLLTDGPRELPIAVTSKQVRDVLKSELSTSVPIATPVIAVNASSNQAPPLPSKEGERHLHTPAEGALPLETPKPGGAIQSAASSAWCLLAEFFFPLTDCDYCFC